MSGATTSPPGRARWRRLATGTVVVLLSAAAIAWLHRHEPSYTERFAPIIVRDVPGRVVEARGFKVGIPADAALESGRVLEAPGTSSALAPERLPTSALWLAVPAHIEATLDSGRVTAFLRDRDGREYAALGKSSAEPGRPFEHGNEGGRMFETNIAGHALAPGFPATGRLYFEIPGDRLEGLHARFHLGVVMTPNDHLVDIDLGIDRARADALRADATPVLRTFAVRRGVL